ncbi:MAG: hypothetical protein AABY42_03415 [Nitrospirota bacterium]
MNYKKYIWIGNKISEKDMERLYRLKQETGKPITMIVAEAIGAYLLRRSGFTIKERS